MSETTGTPLEAIERRVDARTFPLLPVMEFIECTASLSVMLIDRMLSEHQSAWLKFLTRPFMSNSENAMERQLTHRIAIPSAQPVGLYPSNHLHRDDRTSNSMKNH